MSIESTNRVIDPDKIKANELRTRVEAEIIRKGHAKKNSRKGFIKHFHVKSVPCTQCGRGMDKLFATKQIENKRENAPICIPCIMGWKRKPLHNEVKE